MDSLVISSAARLQASRVNATLEQRQALQAQREAQQNRVENLRAEQRLADRTREVIDEARFDRQFTRAITDAQQFDDLRARDTVDERIITRQDRREAANLRAVEDQLFESAFEEANRPLPELPTGVPLPANEINEPGAVFVPFENNLNQFLSDRDLRLSEREADDRAFAQQQALEFERSVQSIETLVTQPDDAPTLEERGAVVDFQA